MPNLNVLDMSPDDPRRNLNPIPQAVVAMYLYGAEYAAQQGGSMDFWDRLDGRRKRWCKEISDDVIAAAKPKGSR